LKTQTPIEADLEIVDLLIQKDQRGIQEMYHKYSSLIYGLIYRILKQQDLAENVLQDTFVKVWQKIHAFDTNKGKFITWVLKIARNTALDAKRSKSERQNAQVVGLQEGIPHESQHHTVEIPVEYIGIKEKVQTLDPKLSQVIDLAFFEEYTHAEIAEELGLPLGTVKSRIRKAFKELRLILADG